MTLVDQPMTWSPLNRMPCSGQAKHRWFEVWPGVCTASSSHPGPLTRSPSRSAMSGTKPQSPPSSTAASAGARRRRMIAMGVGDEDVRDALVAEPGEQSLDMLGKIGAGIDHGDRAFADDIGAGALERERARVPRNDAAQPGRDALEPAVGDGKIAMQRKIGGHVRNLHERMGSGIA